MSNIRMNLVALFTVLAMALSLSAVPTAPAEAAPRVVCGKVKSTSDEVDIGGSIARATIYYKVCKNKRNGNKWVRNMSLVTFYNYEGSWTPCGIADPFDGFKYQLYFNDIGGRNFSKKGEIGCVRDTVHSKWRGLSNTPRLYIYGGPNGHARWHGSLTMKLGFAPDLSKSVSGRYAKKLW